MSKYLDFPLDELPARSMVGDPKAQAYMWICGYAENINAMIAADDEARQHEYTADELIDIAMSHIDGKWGDYIVHGGVFEGYSVDALFWPNVSILLGREVNGGGFFSCSC